MNECYCIVDKRVTPSVNPIFQNDKRGRKILVSKCGVCGNRKVKYVKIKHYEDEEEEEYNIFKKLVDKYYSMFKNSKSN